MTVSVPYLFAGQAGPIPLAELDADFAYLAGSALPSTPTPAEVAAGVTPSNYGYGVGNVFRYGATGNGTTNDISAFNQAVAVASVNGGFVYAPGGFTYALSTNVNIAASNVRIYGDGNSSILKFTDTTHRYSGITFNGTSGSPITGGQVDGLQLVGGGTYGTGNVTGSGILCQYANNIVVTRVTAHEWSDSFMSAGNSVIENGSANLQITNNVGYNISQGLSLFFGGKNLIVTGNFFYNVSLYDGIDIEGTNGTVSGSTATSGSTTTLTDTTQTWVANAYVGLPVVFTIGTVTYSPIITANTTNTLTFAAIGAPVVASTAYAIPGNANVIVADNIVFMTVGPTSAAQGINIELLYYAVVSDNIVYSTAGGGTGNGNGIHVFGSPYTTITGNTVYNNSGYGILIGAGSSFSTVVGNTTNGNTLGSILLTDNGTSPTLDVLINDNNANEGYIVASGNVSFRDPRNSTGPLFGNFGVTGTNTIAVVGTTTAGTATYSNKVATWKLDANGTVCFISISLTWSGHTGTGSIQINGLPFASANYAGYPLSVQSGIAVTSPNVLRAMVGQGLTEVLISQESSAGSNTGVPITASGSLIINGVYPLT